MEAAIVHNHHYPPSKAEELARTVKTLVEAQLKVAPTERAYKELDLAIKELLAVIRIKETVKYNLRDDVVLICKNPECRKMRSASRDKEQDVSKHKCWTCDSECEISGEV